MPNNYGTHQRFKYVFYCKDVPDSSLRTLSSPPSPPHAMYPSSRFQPIHWSLVLLGMAIFLLRQMNMADERVYNHHEKHVSKCWNSQGKLPHTYPVHIFVYLPRLFLETSLPSFSKFVQTTQSKHCFLFISLIDIRQRRFLNHKRLEQD